jgi:hypothetical protein
MPELYQPHKTRLHTDLYRWDIAPIRVATSAHRWGNRALAAEEDFADLVTDDTPFQRWLAARGACTRGRTAVGRQTPAEFIWNWGEEGYSDPFGYVLWLYEQTEEYNNDGINMWDDKETNREWLTQEIENLIKSGSF